MKFSTPILASVVVLLTSAPLLAGEAEGDFRSEGLTVHLAPTSRFLYLIVDEKSMMARGESPLILRDATADGKPVIPMHLSVPRMPAEGLVYRSIPRERERRLVVEQHIAAHEHFVSWQISVRNRSEKRAELDIEIAYPLRLKAGWKLFNGQQDIVDKNEMASFPIHAKSPLVSTWDDERGLAVAVYDPGNSRKVRAGAREYPGMWKVALNWNVLIEPNSSDSMTLRLFWFKPDKGGASAKSRLEGFPK